MSFDKKAIISVFILCPHCEGCMEIYQRNCDIFRHGIFKNSKEQISPHLPKQECDKLIDNDLIFGCGKPFELYVENNELLARICEYK